ncbi:MAG: effector binding domain-containing protein [Bacillota bacterium]
MGLVILVLVVTGMSHDAEIRRAVAYMEAHLQEPLSLGEIAQTVGYSPFHFHRLFLAVTGETPAAFIRRRRLEESARRLAQPGVRMIEVALACQYDSQEAFIRAFRRLYGVTPGRYRRWECAAHQPATPHPVAMGGSTMEPRIVERGPLTIVGLLYFGENQNGEIPRLWDRFNDRMNQIPHQIPGVAYGFCFTDHPNSPNFWYLASVAVERVSEIPPEMFAKSVPAHTYAVFTHRGPVAALGETYARAYKGWLPTAPYQLAANFDFELYDERFHLQDEANSELEIYIPVRPKS